ncbi:MAG: dihydrolipoyl dehydrogenase [Burkholderiales bacterium]
MANLIEVKVPDIGDFENIEVIEVLVKVGDTVKKEDSLITLESDKATMEIPSPQAGVVKEIKIKAGDKVSQGSMILIMDSAAASTTSAAPAAPAKAAVATAPAPVAATVAAPPPSNIKSDLQTDVLVLGGGPGGYTAAFRAADLGKQVMLIERYATLGGVCLNVGCIPSKALLHVAKVITDADDITKHGVTFGAPKIELDKIRGWKNDVVGKLTKGLSGLAKQRKVTVVQGVAKFTSAYTVEVVTADGTKIVQFNQIVIAAGSQAAKIPGLPYDDKRLMDSTDALDLADIPQRMLIVGGGIIGLEMATVYDALGSKVSVVELMDGLIPGCDKDLVKPLHKRIEKRYEAIYLKTKVEKIDAKKDGLHVSFAGDNAPAAQVYDRVLIAVGRRPNGKNINAAAAGVNVDERGYIAVDNQQRTNVAHIFAIGDICGEPMLAHKATHEGKLAAEVIAGHKVAFDARTIPNVAYTDPEIAWMGLSEAEAKAQNVDYEKAVFPWAASGRAIGSAREEGLTKLIFDKQSKKLLGAGIVGINAGELIAETVLALEMGADAQDIGLTIHPHPTLSETVFFGAEIMDGSITDLYMPKKHG